MPIALDDTATEIAVRPSAAADLLWVLLWLRHDGAKHTPAALAALQPYPPALVERARTFWADGPKAFSEMVVLAHASGHLFDLDPSAFLADLERGIPVPPDLPLRTETAADRAAVIERLRRLQDDRALRRRYVKLLRDAWALVGGRWEAEAVPALEKAAAGMRERLARRPDVFEVAPRLKKAGDAFLGLAQAAIARGEAVLSPGYFAGWYLVLDLPGTMLLGTQLEPDQEVVKRDEMEALAAKLRVLADPTRLAILAHLADCSASVTDLMGMLRLAQPTVSAHMRVLRESGLVRAQRNGARTDYSVDHVRLQELLQATSAAIPES